METPEVRLILAFAKPVGGGSTVLIYSIDGGGSWVIQNSSFDGEYVRFIPGSLTHVWFSGASGIGESLDAGATITDRTGDFSGTALGGYGFDT